MIGMREFARLGSWGSWKWATDGCVKGVLTVLGAWPRGIESEEILLHELDNSLSFTLHKK